MFKNLVKKVFGDPNEKEIRRMQPVVDEINALEPEFRAMSADELRSQTERSSLKFATLRASPFARTRSPSRSVAPTKIRSPS